MFTLEQKVVATLVVVSLNVLVLVFAGWFVVLTAIPSALFLAAILAR